MEIASTRRIYRKSYDVGQPQLLDVKISQDETHIIIAWINHKHQAIVQTIPVYQSHRGTNKSFIPSPSSSKNMFWRISLLEWGFTHTQVISNSTVLAIAQTPVPGSAAGAGKLSAQWISKTTKECNNKHRGMPSLAKPTNRGALQLSSCYWFRFSTSSTGLLLSVDPVVSRASRASWETGRRGIASPFASKRKPPFLVAPSTAEVDCHWPR